MSDNIVHAVAGAGGGMASMLLTYPLITVSTRSQVSKSQKTQLATAKQLLKEEGFAGLYSFVYYYWYEAVKDHLQSLSEDPLSIGQNMLTGAIAGSATAVLTNPIWVLNVSSTQGSKPLSTIGAALKIYREEGILGFFQGVIPALVLVINPVIQFTVFERTKLIWEKYRGKTLNGFDFFLLGAVSKLCATAITYPYIVIKSRMQLKKSEDENMRYKSLMDGVRKIIKTEGIQGLYKGIEAKLFQSVLSAAFTFAFKEELFSGASWLLTLLKLREAQIKQS